MIQYSIMYCIIALYGEVIQLDQKSRVKDTTHNNAY